MSLRVVKSSFPAVCPIDVLLNAIPRLGTQLRGLSLIIHDSPPFHTKITLRKTTVFAESDVGVVLSPNVVEPDEGARLEVCWIQLAIGSIHFKEHTFFWDVDLVEILVRHRVQVCYQDLEPGGDRHVLGATILVGLRSRLANSLVWVKERARTCVNNAQGSHTNWLANLPANMEDVVPVLNKPVITK